MATLFMRLLSHALATDGNIDDDDIRWTVGQRFGPHGYFNNADAETRDAAIMRRLLKIRRNNRTARASAELLTWTIQSQ